MKRDEALKKLKERADADDPQALFDYAELVRDKDPDEAYKYTVLAAQLGNPPAMERVGDMYKSAGDLRTARRYYKTAAKSGRLDCSVKLAVMEIGGAHESAALHDLEDLAEIGVRSACAALADYYRAQGNLRQSIYWSTLAK